MLLAGQSVGVGGGVLAGATMTDPQTVRLHLLCWRRVQLEEAAWDAHAAGEATDYLCQQWRVVDAKIRKLEATREKQDS
jgi:hypothetical protein